MTEKLQTFFSALDLDESTLWKLYQHTKTRTYKDKEIIIPVNNRSQEVCVIEKGFVRSFYSTPQKDVTFYFLQENDFCLAPESIYANSPCRFGLESIGPSVITAINFQLLNDLLGDNKKFNAIKEQLLAQYIMDTNERLFYAKFTTPKERYEHLMSTNPRLFNHVPLGYIASYLGITQETLSRLRAPR